MKLLTGLFIATTVVAGCATPPPAPTTADLRPAYDAARDAALERYLDCEGVNDMVCKCREGGLRQEFAAPSLARFDQGYAALIAFQNDPTNAGMPQRLAEAHAVNAIFTAIKTDVEGICAYHAQ